MRLLAIDQGSKHAGFYDGETPTAVDLEENLPRHHRMMNFKKALEEYLKDAMENDGEPFDVVAYETPFNRGLDATRCGWGLAGIIEALATEYGAAVVDVRNTDLKQWAGVKVGRGAKGANESKFDMNKSPMIAKAEEFTLWSWTNLNDHVADAIVLYHYVLENARVTNGE